MKNKDFGILMTLVAVLTVVIYLAVGCRKVDYQPTIIDMGVKSTSTAIKHISETNSVVTAKFQTTPGAKYSVLVIPFGSDESVMTDGFTAADSITNKVYNLKDLPKKNYDLIFMDISGKEIKYPLTIK